MFWELKKKVQVLEHAALTAHRIHYRHTHTGTDAQPTHTQATDCMILGVDMITAPNNFNAVSQLGVTPFCARVILCRLVVLSHSSCRVSQWAQPCSVSRIHTLCLTATALRWMVHSPYAPTKNRSLCRNLLLRAVELCFECGWGWRGKAVMLERWMFPLTLEIY